MDTFTKVYKDKELEPVDVGFKTALGNLFRQNLTHPPTKEKVLYEIEHNCGTACCVLGYSPVIFPEDNTLQYNTDGMPYTTKQFPTGRINNPFDLATYLYNIPIEHAEMLFAPIYYIVSLNTITGEGFSNQDDIEPYDEDDADQCYINNTPKEMAYILQQYIKEEGDIETVIETLRNEMQTNCELPKPMKEDTQ